MATYKYLTANLKLDADSLFIDNFKLPLFAFNPKTEKKQFKSKEYKLKTQQKEKN